jgi:hypothetical protein
LKGIVVLSLLCFCGKGRGRRTITGFGVGTGDCNEELQTVAIGSISATQNNVVPAKEAVAKGAGQGAAPKTVRVHGEAPQRRHAPFATASKAGTQVLLAYRLLEQKFGPCLRRDDGSAANLLDQFFD